MNALNNLHEKIETLCNLVPQLDECAQLVQADSSVGMPWRDSLMSKLRVQSSGDTPLIVAIAGGTNVGKSTVFNHLARDNASGITSQASGTKYPVCLVPESWADEQKLQKLFDGFVVEPWKDSVAPLTENEQDVLYWRVGAHVPPQLILLDTPDVDSTNVANWRRAEKIRQIADVVIAILTTQKYNDAACVNFFKQAAKSGKEFIVLFNQFEKDDISSLPSMLAEVVKHLQQPPIFAYIALHDREASKSLGLPFYAIPLNADGAVESDRIDFNAPKSLTDELACMHFEELKTRSLSKSLVDAMNAETGLGKWLSEISAKSKEFALRLDILKEMDSGKIEPLQLPRGLVLKELQQQRNSMRNSLTKLSFIAQTAVGKAWSAASSWFKKGEGSTVSPEEEFLEQERVQMIHSAEKIYKTLRNQAQTDSVLGDQIREILEHATIEDIIDRIQAEHKASPVISEEFRNYVKTEWTQWCEKHPWQSRIYKAVDAGLAIARPVATVTLGAFLLYEPTVTLGTATILAGTSNSVDIMTLGDLFCNIQKRFCIERAQWLQNIIRQEFHIDELLDKMNRQIAVKGSAELKLAQSLQQELASP